MSFFWCGALELAHSRTRYGFIYEQIVHQMQIVRTFIYFQPWSTIIENVMFIVCNNNNKQHVYDVWWHALQCMQCMHFRFQYIPMHCTQFNLSHLLTILICKPKTNEMEKKEAKQNHYYECRTKYECGFFKEHYQIFIYLMLFRAFNCDHLKTEL